MTTKIISGTITGGYTLSSAYDTLSITSSGAITGAPGIYADGGRGLLLLNTGTVINDGSITGGVGATERRGAGNGGSGVDLDAVCAVSNDGWITGGAGGYAANHRGGTGGNAVEFSYPSSTLTNSRTITGGAGGNSVNMGGWGGDAVESFSRSLTITNSSTITGGAGGSGGVMGGDGRYAVDGGGTLFNTGLLAGGAGGVSKDAGGQGGAAVLLVASTIVNSGSIRGGAGGATTVKGSGGDGGGGLILETYCVLYNMGSISGGDGGIGVVKSGHAGDGVLVTNAGGTVVNGSSISDAALISGYVGVWTNGAPSTVTNYGTIIGTGGTAVVLMDSSDRLVVEAGSTLMGAALGGGGTLEFAAGNGTITGLGSSFSGFGTYQVDDGGVWAVNQSQAVNGAFEEQAGATLTLGRADVLTLSGMSNLAGLINGAGTVRVANATVGSLTIGGSDALNTTSAISQTGAVTLGDGATSASISIATGAVWTIDGAVGILNGGSAPQSLQVSGTLIKSSVAGVSKIGVAVTDTGLIEAATGTLDIAKALAGSGVLKIDAGAVLEADSSAASTLTATFNGASATLALAAPTAFAATLAGFAAGDTIDLLKIKATAAHVNAKDQLVIVDRKTTVATLQLTGSYSGATFTVASDSHGGTDITLITAGANPPGPAASPAHSVLALVSAMAGLAPGSGSTVATPAQGETWRAILLGPRPQIA